MAQFPLTFVFLGLLCLFPLIICNNNTIVNIRQLQRQIWDKILDPEKYDKRTRPAGSNATDDPTVVHVNTLVRLISKIDDYKMEYDVQLTFRQKWVDDRLKYDDILLPTKRDGFSTRLNYQTLTDSSEIWTPDIFFSNAKNGRFHNIMTPNVYIRIYPSGEVFYSTLIDLTLNCPLDLKYYPLDRQICSIRMASYGWTTDLVILWDEINPVQINKNLKLQQFTLEEHKADYCHVVTNIGKYSCLKIDFTFKRDFSYYLIWIYIPCCMLVIISWVSFWLDPGAITARISLGALTLLTMTTQTSGVNASLPPVPYIKAIDVWIGACLTFVFATLMEFALVNRLLKSDVRNENMMKKARDVGDAQVMNNNSNLMDVDGSMANSMVSTDTKPLIPLMGEPLTSDMRQCVQVHELLPPPPNRFKLWISKFPRKSKMIDIISRVGFPLAFALFNLMYWSTYLYIEDKE